MRVWLLLVLGCVVLGFVVERTLLFSRAVAEHYRTPRVLPPGEAEFRAANRRIIRSEGERAAFGNTPAAEELARRFSTTLAQARKKGFTAGDDSGFSLSKHRFLTYCRLNADSCVLLVHVPELRHFTPDAQETLANLAWVIAHKMANEAGLPPGGQLVVGVKGMINYEAVLIGGFSNRESPLDDIAQDKRGFGLEKNRLFYPYFASEAASEAPPVSAPPTPAAEPENPHR